MVRLRWRSRSLGRPSHTNCSAFPFEEEVQKRASRFRLAATTIGCGGQRLSYLYRMLKKAISVTLAPNNLRWLRARSRQVGARSLSEMIDIIVRSARGAVHRVPRSVVGSVRIDESDSGLQGADQYVRGLFRMTDRPSKRRKVS